MHLKKAEKLAQESEERYRVLIDSAPDAIIVHQEGKVLYANQAAVELYGAESFEQLASHNIMKLIPAQDAKESTRRMQTLMEGQKLSLREARIIRLDGQDIPIEVISSPVEYKGVRAAQAILRNITERKKAEEALKASEENYRHLLQYAPTAIYEIDYRGPRFKSVNDAMCRLTGYSREELLSMSPADLLDPESRKHFQERIRRGLAGEKIDDSVEFRAIAKDRRELWIILNVKPTYKDGKLDSALVVVHDITERKHAESELREIRDYLDKLLNYANAPIIVWDQEFKVTKFNHAFERLTGYEAAEVLGKNLSILFPEQTKEESLTEIQHTLTGEHWEVVEIPILRKEGNVRTVLWNSANIYTEDGKTLMATIAQGQDITERKQFEDELRETRNYLDNLLNYANAPIIVWDTEFKITRFNHAFEHMTGLSSNDVIGKPLDLLFPADKKEEALSYIKRALEGEHWEAVEIPIQRADGAVRIALWNSANVYDPSGKNFIATIAQGQDITERKKLEEQLRNAERMAAIGETAAMVGHDLRNPLQAIVGFISVTQEQLKNTNCPSEEKETLEEPLRAIADQSQYMNKIVSDLQDYAEPLNPELQEADLLAQANAVILTMQIPDAVQVSVEIPKDFPKISVDPLLMKRVFTNLFRNAIEAMPNGGRLIIDASQADGAVLINVKDTGVGVAQENLPKMFTPLFTTKAKGQGFGLPVCKRIIEAHNGTITFESQEGKGTTFMLKMPLTKNAK